MWTVVLLLHIQINLNVYVYATSTDSVLYASELECTKAAQLKLVPIPPPFEAVTYAWNDASCVKVKDLDPNISQYTVSLK